MILSDIVLVWEKHVYFGGFPYKYRKGGKI
jgi:hypothetical protein